MRVQPKEYNVDTIMTPNTISNGMRFITDLSKGILGKPDSKELWVEILSHIPDSFFLKSDLKILVVGYGHGTEADIIAERMLRIGRTKNEIRDAIYLIDKYDVFRYPAELKGYKNIITEDFLEWKTNMKFDCVVGNPPYQTGNGETGGARSLWRKFVKKSFDVVNDDGYVALICPGFPHKSNDLGNLFVDNTPLYLNNDVAEHFPGIGSKIKSWVVQSGSHQKDFVVDGIKWNDDITIADPTAHPLKNSIFNKISEFNTFECKQDRGYSSTQLKNDDDDYFPEPLGGSIFPIRHAANLKICYVKKPTECHTKRKVMMTFSGYPAFEYYDEETPMSSCYQMSGYIEVSDSDEGANLITLYTTKTYDFLSKGYSNAGMKGIKNYQLPKVDLTRSWTDEELYEHFNLTQEEIDYIEANVK